MKKYKKLLVTCALVAMPFITSSEAIDLTYSKYGVNITINNARENPYEGFDFDTVTIAYAGQIKIVTQDQAMIYANDILSRPENSTISFLGTDIKVSEIKQLVGLFEGQVGKDIQSQLDTQLATLSPEKAAALKAGIAQYAAQRADFASNGKPTVDMEQMIEQVQKQVVPMTYSATAQISDLVDTRIDTIDTADRLAFNQGIASGDMGYDFKHGVWIKGNISKDNYKAIAGQKYKARTAGAVVGYDVKFNENIMAGLAFGYQQSTISSALKLRSLVGIAYGQYNFDMPVFVGAKYSYTASVFTGKEKTSGINLLALGLNNFHTLSTEVGYNHALAKNAEITPTAGLKYIIHNWNLPKKWTANVTPKAKNGSAAYATLGLKLKGLVEYESYNFMPYISAGFDTRIAHRKTKLTLTNKTTGASVVFPVDVAEKTKFTAGTGVTAKINEIFSTSLGYKYTKTKLYHSHGGTLGLRLDF